MLNKLRNFSKGKIASVLVAIIIVPFVFWGMGSVFSGGNTNSVGKINNVNISTQDLMDHINNSRLKTETIKDNIDENILEELLTELVASKMIDLEIKKQNIKFSDTTLAERIRKNKSFQDENNNFSRIKYEKFLIENNISATEFEIRLKNKELKNKLFTYISGGVKSPYFLANKTYNDQKKEIEISYINLTSVYKKKNLFTESEIDQFINDNKNKLKKELIDFSYIILKPENLSEGKEFDADFFLKIDEIENLIANNTNIKNIASKFNLQMKFIKDYTNENKNIDPIFKEIYLNKDTNEVQLIDKNDYFLLFKVEKIKKILPNRNNKSFIDLVKLNLYEQNKFDYNKDLLIRIQKNNFSNSDFINLVNDKKLIKKIKIQSNKDDSKFSINSIKLLYSMPENNFVLMNDNENYIYLAKIENIFKNNLIKNSEDLNLYNKESINKIRSNLYGSYDLLMNEQYKIKINQNTLERIKNYFR